MLVLPSILGFQLLYLWTWGCTLIQGKVLIFFSLSLLFPPRNLLTCVHEWWAGLTNLLFPFKNASLSWSKDQTFFSLLIATLMCSTSITCPIHLSLLCFLVLLCYVFPLELAKYMSRLYLWKNIKKRWQRWTTAVFLKRVSNFFQDLG